MKGVKNLPEIDFIHDDFINCFGIQPIFTEGGDIIKSNVFHVYREYDFKKNAEGYFRFDNCKDLRNIKLSTIPYSLVKSRVLEDIINKGRVFSLGCTVDRFLEEPKEKYNDMIKMQLYYLWYVNKFINGNRLISSNKKLLDKLVLDAQVKFKRVLVPESVLADNVLLIACKGSTAMDNGIVLCPFIDRDLYMEWLDMKGLSDDIQTNPKDQYPLLKKWAEIYRHYSGYINENVPRNWYISKHKEYYNFYTTIVFDKS